MAKMADEDIKFWAKSFQEQFEENMRPYIEAQKREMETGKCSRCGEPLEVLWPSGRKEGTSTPPYLFCGPCHEKDELQEAYISEIDMGPELKN